MSKLKNKIMENPSRYRWLFTLYNKVCGRNKKKISSGSKLIVGASILKGNKINISGTDNVVTIDDLCKLDNTFIYINGNHNRVHISNENGFDGSSIWIEDDNNEVEIGNHNRFNKDSHIAVLEGTKLTIGEDGLFAPEVQIRTSDSHSIVDLETDKRINGASDITIGNHVWIATRSVVLKGATISDNSVIGINSTVTKKLEEANALYVGSPAKQVKSNITWTSKRL